LVLAMLAPVVGGCSSETFSNISLLPKADTFRPDWLSFTGGKNEFMLRPVTAEDLVGPDGNCVGAAPGPSASAAEDGAAAPTLVQGGIALQMTECDVVRRSGPPEKVDLGTSERGERAAVFTYSRGSRPGVYRFVGGRLASIERGPEAPAPARPQKAKPAPKKPKDA